MVPTTAGWRPNEGRPIVRVDSGWTIDDDDDLSVATALTAELKAE